MADVIQLPAKIVETETWLQRAAGAEFMFDQIEPVEATAGAISAAELYGDEEIVHATRKNLLAAKMGEITLPETVSATEKPIRSLHEAIVWASQGDPEGKAMVRANVSTHAMETLFKAGNYKRVGLSIHDGEISQNGQSMDDVHKNAYLYASKHPVLAERTIAEANNGARIKRAYNEGLLEDRCFVVFSLCEEDMTDEELDELLFFSKTKSLSIQLTAVDEQGLYTETAFVAGTAEEGADRHDRQAVEAVAGHFGIDYSDDSPARIINKPILIPKSLLSGGVIDLVEMLDEQAGTFFGQNKPRQDYNQFREFCEQREASFDEDIDEIVEQLMIEAEMLGDPYRASKRMAKLVEERLVEKAIEDDAIEAWVFGPESAKNIELARTATMAGHDQEAKYFERQAVDTAKSGACTGGAGDSCGLESINVQTEEGKKIKEKVKAEEGDTILRDTERACKCGRKGTIIYAYNNKKVNKYCEGCEMFETKFKKAA